MKITNKSHGIPMTSEKTATWVETPLYGHYTTHARTCTHAHTVSWPCAAAGLHWRKHMYQRVCPCCPYWAAPVSIQKLEAQFSIRGPPLGPCSGRPPFRKARVELRQLTSFINGFCVWLPRCWFHSIYIYTYKAIVFGCFGGNNIIHLPNIVPQIVPDLIIPDCPNIPKMILSNYPKSEGFHLWSWIHSTTLKILVLNPQNLRKSFLEFSRMKLLPFNPPISNRFSPCSSMFGPLKSPYRSPITIIPVRSRCEVVIISNYPSMITLKFPLLIVKSHQK